MTEFCYGDAYVINGKGVAVFGGGKTDVMRHKIIANEDENNFCINNDYIRFDLKNGKLYVYGHFEDVCHQVDFMFYHYYVTDSPNNKFEKITLNKFVFLAKSDIEYCGMNVDELYRMLEGQNIEYYKIPFCETVEERAEIIKRILF